MKISKRDFSHTQLGLEEQNFFIYNFQVFYYLTYFSLHCDKIYSSYRSACIIK